MILAPDHIRSSSFLEIQSSLSQFTHHPLFVIAKHHPSSHPTTQVFVWKKIKKSRRFNFSHLSTNYGITKLSAEVASSHFTCTEVRSVHIVLVPFRSAGVGYTFDMSRQYKSM